MTVDTDNTNTRTDETEKSSGTRRRQESRAVVLLLPAMLPSVFIIQFYICVPYLATVSSTVQLIDLLVSKCGSGGGFRSVEMF